MNDTPQTTAAKAFWPTVARAGRGRCPNCGDAPLFRGYLKPVDACDACGEELGHIRADDGPAWLTILVVTHLLAPFMLVVLYNNPWPMWTILVSVCIPTILLTLLLLPRAKGLFIGMIWRSGCTGAER